ncbi:FGGY-family carbohydrate kinase [Sporomusa acidovorans]|uniref:Xylulose kinase n=1 Tax=Sporomusa acidovorans (strain ATCC 49682 / DSM 3132 / Mol) TaxID=1123286 RepID=A0ABZ3JCG4_SPOA4|nr:FGGY-family carbohydrate kinase [Sporomusa acidovorans]OZC16989.1 xylulose kinase [Sporomusa acidovorans DSM 3132]SDF33406.1 Sugar (pentulose or hexulose) kinase [Sporomusa acidovorans]
MALMGIDVGTTGVKCTITDNCGNYLSDSYAEYHTFSPVQGYFELNPNDVWDSTKKVIKLAASKVTEKILGVSVSSFGESFVPIDKNGNVLMNSMVYTDIRGVGEIKDLLLSISEQEIMERTGLKASSTYSLPKIMWIKKNKPEIFNDIWKILLYGSYILYRLGNICTIDYTLAARTMSLNVEKKKWDEKILAAAGLTESIFPDVYPMGTIVGTINKELALELGLPQDMPLVTGAHDQICAAIGSGTYKIGEAMDGMGSVDCIAPIFSVSVNTEKLAENNYAMVPYIDDKFTTYAYIYDGGTLLKWYRDTFGQEESRLAAETNSSVYDIFNSYAAKEPTEILVLPHFSGSALPYMDPFSKGAMIGLDSNTNKAKIFRALLEGIAYELKINIEKMEENGIHIDSLRACGGGSRSDIWLQIKADIFNKEIKAVKIKEAGTLGVIIMTGFAVGLFPSFEEAMNSLVKIEKIFAPNPKNVDIYNKNYNKYKGLYASQKKLLETD